jgi:transcriptional regulator with XRE-family HTH domain
MRYNEDKRPFAKNLRKARVIKRWSQYEAAKRIGIKRSTLGAYEEDRSTPHIDDLDGILSVYGIKNWRSFILDENYFEGGGQINKGDPPTTVEKLYSKLDKKLKPAVDALLGME